MARRPLVVLLLLTVGDYLVWNWSLNGNHDVIALVSGLTLPPLALASLSMLAIAGARLLGEIARRQAADVAPPSRRRSRGYEAQAASGHMQPTDARVAQTGSAEAPTRKIAA
jgi:hypothetical protein